MFWSVDEFCDGFLKLMDHLELDRVRLSFCILSLLKCMMQHLLANTRILFFSCTRALCIMRNLLRASPPPPPFTIILSLSCYIRCTYWVHLWEPSLARSLQRERLDVLACTRCFCAMDSRILLHLNRPSQPRRKLKGSYCIWKLSKD